MKIYLAPSLMCMDFLHVEEQIKVLNEHMDMLHYDVMDGHFCKNIALSTDMLKAVKSVSQLPVDVHMMVEHPDEYVDVFCNSGADIISLQAETINTFAFRIINHIRERGAKVGIVLNPATPLSYIEEYMDEIDLLTIMTVDVGFAGQKFNDKMLDKIKMAWEYRQKHGLNYVIQADGAVNERTYKKLIEAGTESFVIGTSGLFGKSGDLNTCCQLAKKEFTQAWREAGGEAVDCPCQ